VEAPRAEPADIVVRARYVAGFLAAAVTLFATLDLLTQTLDHRLQPTFPIWTQLVKLVDLDREFSLPTWYSIVLLASTAALLGLVSWRKRGEGASEWRYWLLLAGVFTLFSVDEQVLGHESAGQIIGDQLNAGGIFYYAWVIPASFAVAAAAVILLPFLKSLDARTRRGLLLAGALHVSGALGMEMLSGVIADGRGVESYAYAMVTSIEEILELSGVSLLFLVAFDAARRLAPDISIELR
jgi:hypothetical protein